MSTPEPNHEPNSKQIMGAYFRVILNFQHNLIFTSIARDSTSFGPSTISLASILLSFRSLVRLNWGSLFYFVFVVFFFISY